MVATHLNTENIHNHIVINSVSLKTGKKFYDNYCSRDYIRAISDFICQYYGLSTLDKPWKRKSAKQEAIDDLDKQLKELAPRIKSLNEDIQNLYMIERRTILWKKEADKAVVKERQRLEEIERSKGKGKSKKYVR